MGMKGSRAVAWGSAVLVLAGGVFQVARWLTTLDSTVGIREIVDGLSWSFFLPITFAALAALVIVRQPRNIVGWLMMLVGLGLNNPVTLIVGGWSAPPADPGWLDYLLIWLDRWSWLPAIFPIFLIPFYFPDGKALTPKWGWVPKLALATAGGFVLVSSFSSQLGPIDVDWTIDNPIGFLPASFLEGPFFILFGAGLLTSVTASVASLFVRYRRSAGTERQQIKWLMVSGVFFLIVYTIAFVLPDSSGFSGSSVFSILFTLSILLIPVAIAVSIFRYRLWDLDVVVNRALIYGPLTTVLAGVFAMLIAVTTELAKQTLGTQSQALGAAIGAVAVAVIFQPLRSRIQSYVDKRFYPQKANLAQGLVEVDPGYWTFLDVPRLVGLSLDHVRLALGTPTAAFYLRRLDGVFALVEARGAPGEPPLELVLPEETLNELGRKRVVAAEAESGLVGHIPVYVDRGRANELLGLLSIGTRSNGRGYSGDDLKAMVELGGKIGLALNALRLAESLNDRMQPNPDAKPAAA